MDFNVRVEKNCLIVRVNGEIDHHSAAEIKDVIVKEYSANTVRNIIFDFSELTFMDSAGIGMLIGRYKQVCVNNGCVIAIGIKPPIERIFGLSGLDKIIKRCDNVEEAFDSLNIKREVI